MGGVEQSFALAPAELGPYLVVGLVAMVSGLLLAVVGRVTAVRAPVLVLAWAALVAVTAGAARSGMDARVRLGRDALALPGLVPSPIALAALDVAHAAVRPRDGQAPYFPHRRLAGSNAPGLLSGRWTLRDGRSAWVHVTDRPRDLVVVPFRGDSALVLSLADPAAFVAALRTAAAGAGAAPVALR